nr:sialoadhesin-like [Misgurnus anguillicaudatus]
MEMCFRISLMFLLMTADVDGQQDWGVDYSPSYVCALRGSTVKITCTIKYPYGRVVTKAFWTKVAHKTDGEPPDLCLVPENRRGVQCISKYKDIYSITLTDVTEADKHIYYCRFITDQVGGKWTGQPGVQLDVTDLQVETNQRVKEGDSVTLTCKTTCSLPEETTFIWYRNTQRVTEYRVNPLYLRSVSRDYSGVYRCVTAVRGSERLLSSPGVYLSVEYPPEKTSVSISGSGEIMEGDSVTLTCSSESNPPVQIYSWFKGVTFMGSGQIYSITSIRSDHSGEYKCKSRNKHGEQYTKAVMLNVMYAPRNVVASISESGEIMEGDSVTLTCSSESNPPVQNYSWFKENETSSVGSGQTYSITNINSSHSGWFYCEAQNEVGSQRSAAVSLIVKEVQGSALYTVLGIVAGCGGLFFIIILIILFIRKKRRDGGSEAYRQNLDNNFNVSAGAASANDVPIYSLISTNQNGASETADAVEVQYSSVQHFRKKEMNESKEKDCQYMNFKKHHTSDPHGLTDVIYSYAK